MRRLFAFLLLLIVAGPAIAQFDRMANMNVGRTNAITPELVVNARANPGGAAELAIVMHVREGWHGYWLNPGDAGLPMTVEWELPDGWSVGPLQYPVPSRLLVSGIVNYVYEKDYAVLARLNVPAGATGSQPIKARMRWLACTDKVCVPEEGEAELNVPTGGMVTPDVRFDAWRKALPRPLSSPAHFDRAGGKLRIAIPLPASVAVKDPYFFAETEDAIDYEAPQSFRRAGDTLVVDVNAAEGAAPATVAGVLAYGAGEGLEVRAVPGAVPNGGDPVGGPAEAGLVAAVLGALLGGLLLNLMPCVFPILAMKAMHLARAGGGEVTARREAVSYMAGAVVGTAALGVALLLIRAGGNAAGWAFQLQDPRSIFLLLLLATAITLNLLKVFELPVLAGEANSAGSFGTGALAAFVATPCSGPFMGAALGAALLLPLWGSVAVFAALGLGLALPFLLVAFFPGLRRRLPKPGPWMARLQRFLAVPMAATAAAALWLLYRLAGPVALGIGALFAVLLGLLLAGIGWRQRFGATAWPLAIGGSLALAAVGLTLLPPLQARTGRIASDVPAWSEAAVSAAREGDKPVFVYFTADWCLTCKANEAAAIDRAETQRAFRDAGVNVLVGDWTDGDPAIGRFLESRGRAGVPLYLWYAPGAAEPEELPQILTPSMLVGRARASAMPRPR